MPSPGHFCSLLGCSGMNGITILYVTHLSCASFLYPGGVSGVDRKEVRVKEKVQWGLRLHSQLNNRHRPSRLSSFLFLLLFSFLSILFSPCSPSSYAAPTLLPPPSLPLLFPPSTSCLFLSPPFFPASPPPLKWLSFPNREIPLYRKKFNPFMKWPEFPIGRLVG